MQRMTDCQSVPLHHRPLPNPRYPLLFSVGCIDITPTRLNQ